MKRLTTCLVAMAMGFSVINAHAISLTDLFAGGSIQVGDKLFADWTELNNERCPEEDCISGGVDTASIQVTGVGDGSAGNEYGLQFTASEGALTQVGDSFLDVWFGFSVTADPGKSIVGTRMTGTTAIGDDTGAFVSVIKDVFADYDLDPANWDEFDGAGLDNRASFEIYDDPSFGDTDLDGSAGFAALDKIWVQDNIFIDGFDSSAELVELTQRFIQRDDDVAMPTPATLALFGVGLLGLALMRRRQLQRI